VDFNHSRIYDEFDFKGVNTVSVEGLCTDLCRIYASVTPESQNLAQSILIQTSKGFVRNCSSKSRFVNKNTTILMDLIQSTPTLSIVNANGQMAAGYAEIYEAEGFHRPFSTMVGALTVMSTRPFTLKQAHQEGSLPEGVLAQMAGFDALGYATDPCPYLYYLIRYGPFPGFTMEVNGPIISLLYDLNQFHFPPGDLTATLGITNTRQLERAGWLGSPGFHGCLDKQPYRSSLYDFISPLIGEVSNDQPEGMSVDVVTNTDNEHPVTLTDSDTSTSYRQELTVIFATGCY
ncbi:hypothetical protein PMAYCL1PPCAC_17077, partial [Pristionchus mayeri]